MTAVRLSVCSLSRRHPDLTCVPGFALLGRVRGARVLLDLFISDVTTCEVWHGRIHVNVLMNPRREFLGFQWIVLMDLCIGIVIRKRYRNGCAQHRYA